VTLSGVTTTSYLNATTVIGVAVDSAGVIYFASYSNHRVYKLVDGVATVIAGNGSIGSADNANGTSASLNFPYGLAIDTAGNLYVTDYGNSRIRKIANDATHTVTTIAGSTSGYADNANGTSAQFSVPRGITIDGAGNLYITDGGNHKIRKIANDATHTVTTIAGSTNGYTNGIGSAARFAGPE